MKTPQRPTISFCHNAVNFEPKIVKSGTSPSSGFGVAVTNVVSRCISVLLKGFRSTRAERRADIPCGTGPSCACVRGPGQALFRRCHKCLHHPRGRGGPCDLGGG